MQYRKMPNTNEELSVLGFGCMRLPTKGSGGPLGVIDAQEAKNQILHAIDKGLNYLDTAYPYHAGGSESFLGEHILCDKDLRAKLKVATKLPCYIISNPKKFDEIFNKQLSKLNIDYVDYYLLHSLNGSSWNKMRDLGIIEWMDKVKAEGKVKKMGFSFHGKHSEFLKIVDGYDFDFVQVQYNILDVNFQAGIKGIEYARSKGLGVIAMEPLRGGSLVGKIPKEIQEIYDNASIQRSAAQWAFKFIYNNPNIDVVLSGMNDYEHIDENIKIACETLPNSLCEEELKIIEDVRNKYHELLSVGCTECGYCMPCTVGINIPGCFKNLNNYYSFGKKGAKLHHAMYHGMMTEDGKAHFASSCTECGKCEKQCPQNIEIIKELKRVSKELENPFIKALSYPVRLYLNKGKQKKKQ